MVFIFNCAWHFKQLVLFLKFHITFLNVIRVVCNFLCQVSTSDQYYCQEESFVVSLKQLFRNYSVSLQKSFLSPDGCNL